MDDARTVGLARAGRLRAVPEGDDVRDSAVQAAATGVDRHARRLVDDDEKVVLQEDLQRKVLGLEGEVEHRRYVHLDAVALPHADRGAGRCGAVHADGALADEPLEYRAAERLQPGRQEEGRGASPRPVRARRTPAVRRSRNPGAAGRRPRPHYVRPKAQAISTLPDVP